MHHTDRRVVRSAQPKTAMYLYLARQATRCDLEGIALADEQGRLITGSRGSRHVDLGALAAAAKAQAGRSQGSVKRRLIATRLEHGGRSFYLGSLGAKRPKVQEIKAAVGRILGA